MHLGQVLDRLASAGFTLRATLVRCWGGSGRRPRKTAVRKGVRLVGAQPGRGFGRVSTLLVPELAVQTDAVAPTSGAARTRLTAMTGAQVLGSCPADRQAMPTRC